MKTVDFMLLALVVISITTTYYIKKQSDLKIDKLRVMEHKIAEEQDYLELLKAQLALLGEPSRIKNLVSFYQEELKLSPTNTLQLISGDDLAKLKSRNEKVLSSNTHAMKNYKKG